MASSAKPEVHNISQRRQTGRQSHGRSIRCIEIDCICSCGPEIYLRASDSQTDRHAHHQTQLPYLEQLVSYAKAFEVSRQLLLGGSKTTLTSIAASAKRDVIENVK